MNLDKEPPPAFPNFSKISPLKMQRVFTIPRNVQTFDASNRLNQLISLDLSTAWNLYLYSTEFRMKI